MEDGIKHVYHNVGIFRVTVQVDNSLGSDSAVLYLHVTCMLLLLLVYDISYILCPLKNIIQNQVSRRSPLVILAAEERRLRVQRKQEETRAWLKGLDSGLLQIVLLHWFCRFWTLLRDGTVCLCWAWATCWAGWFNMDLWGFWGVRDVWEQSKLSQVMGFHPICLFFSFLVLSH